jgi:hypothetical protein
MKAKTKYIGLLAGMAMLATGSALAENNSNRPLSKITEKHEPADTELEEACQELANYANQGDNFVKLFRSSPRPLKSTNQEVLRIFGISDTWSINQVSDSELWKLDLDGDGVDDYFGIIIYRSTPEFISRGYFRSGASEASKTVITTESANSLITLNGKQYVHLNANAPHDELLQKIMNNGSHKEFCRLTERKSMLTITKGENIPVCIAITSGDIKPIGFKHEDIQINYVNKREEISADDDVNATIKGLAKVDLGNEGKFENAAIIYTERVTGPSCLTSEIKIVDENNQIKTDSYINKIIYDFLDGCNVSQTLFTSKGLTYIDEQSSDDGSQTILLIKGGQGQKQCDITKHTYYDVDLEK